MSKSSTYQHPNQTSKSSLIGHILRKPNSCITRQASNGTLKAKEEEEDQETPGEEILRQN